MDPPREARIYRRRPFLRRIADIPVDIAVGIQNEIAAFDWDLAQERMSIPLAVGLNALLVWVKLGYWLQDPYADLPRGLKESFIIPSLSPDFSSLVVIPCFAYSKPTDQIYQE
ncbi:hypothetical protein BGZ94_004610 [Podila epigama]|nr:hypothetical protein BGZ94_004610 [Podila epigama]